MAHEFFSRPKSLVWYARDKNRNKIGVAIAFKRNDLVFVGYSKCNKVDTFDRDVGIHTALERADLIGGVKYKATFTSKIPNAIRQHVLNMCSRAQRYYEEKNDILVFKRCRPNILCLLMAGLRNCRDICKGLFSTRR